MCGVWCVYRYVCMCLDGRSYFRLVVCVCVFCAVLLGGQIRCIAPIFRFISSFIPSLTPSPIFAINASHLFSSPKATKQFRFTPPIQAMLAFNQALEEHKEEGGWEGRLARYQANWDVLSAGLADMGFHPYLDEDIQGCIITTYVRIIEEETRGESEAKRRGEERRGD